MTTTDHYAVPGRECGGCTACCTDLAITSDGMDKLAGVPCTHCTATQGCAIYEARPPVCRSYYCVWRGMPALDESWRPDLSGILIIWATAPPGAPSDHAVDLVLIGPPETIVSPRFAGLATGFIAQGVTTFLDLPRGPGFMSTNARLNDLLAPAIAARSRIQAIDLLRSAYATMMSRPRQAVSEDDKAASRAGSSD